MTELIVKLVVCGLLLCVVLTVVFAFWDVYESFVNPSTDTSASESVQKAFDSVVLLGSTGDAESLRGDMHRGGFFVRFGSFITQLVEGFGGGFN